MFKMSLSYKSLVIHDYSLDPIHYYTTPGLACDAALRMSHVDLQLITDVNMYHFVENSIRGGISMISTRHAQANSPSFPDTYDSSLPNQNLIYLDANNLYGWQCLNLCQLMVFVFSNRRKNYPTMLRMVIYSRWIFSIQLTYMIATMTTRSPSRHQ